MDDVKADLRNEFPNKNDIFNLDKRISKLEADSTTLFEEQAKSNENIELNSSKIDGHSNRLNSDSE